MKRIFLGGGNNSKSVSDSMNSVFNNNTNSNNNTSNHSHYSGGKGEMQFIEVWDYMGGASFRGFVAEKVGRGRVEKTLFLFFENVEGTQLKHGYVDDHPIIVLLFADVVRPLDLSLLSSLQPNVSIVTASSFAWTGKQTEFVCFPRSIFDLFFSPYPY